MPTMGVDVVVINSSGQILLTERNDFPVWCLPGGGVEDGESVAQTAVREVREETGIDIVLIRLVGIYSRPKWLNGGDHVIVFAAYPVSGVLTAQESEVADMGYFEPSQLPERLLWWHRHYVRDALNAQGGSVAKTVDVSWPFEPGLTRQQIYDKQNRGEIAPETFSLLFEEPSSHKVLSEVG